MSAATDVRQSKGATVRLFSAPWPVRATFRVLEHTAPGLGARWAEQIWSTLPRPKQERAPRAVPPMPPEPFTIAVDGHQVIGESWGEGPPVYLVHGWGGYAGQLAAFVPALVSLGYRAVAFDMPSHGRSAPGVFGPRSSSIPEFAGALAAVAATFGPAHAVIAHSMGGTATAAALRDGLPVRRVALIAPMASPVAHLRQLADVLGFGERTLRRLQVRIGHRIGAPMHHFDVPDLGRTVAVPPTLVVHDRDDASTPVADGEAIAAAWPGSRLRVTSGLGHRRILRDPAVVAEVLDFVST
ncbi:alpha/beta fold hydrolase [Planosporangium sp. 12N6]|uniref:alpha/beta fold hydrolase n=1 Tax=Planosporangium spinosum TaxID=3402278 RepID=UPI003CFA54CE